MHLFPILLLAKEDDSAGDWAIKVVLFLLFIGVPAIKSLMETLKKSRESSAQGGVAEAERRARETAAKQRWEDLLRGERAPEAEPPPVPVERAAPPARRQVTTLADPESASEPPALSNLQRAPSEDEAEATGGDVAPDEETIAIEANERRLREERARRSELLRLEREGGVSRRASVESKMATSFDVGAAPAGPVPVVDRLQPQASRATTARAAFLRSAVIGREVMDLPLGMRPMDQWPGSPRP